MIHRTFSLKTLAFLFAIPFAFVNCMTAAQKPNIVMLLADDHSAADMSVYGAADIPTPHLDAMASRGMVFERAFVNSAALRVVLLCLRGCIRQRMARRPIIRSHISPPNVYQPT